MTQPTPLPTETPEQLAAFEARIQNGEKIEPGDWMPAAYRQQLIREEAAADKGQLARSPISNLLPVEAKEVTSRRPLGMSDLRLALEVGDCSLGQMPDVIQHIMGGWPDGVLEGWNDLPEDDEKAERAKDARRYREDDSD